MNVMYYIELNNIDINKQNKSGRTLLHYAYINRNEVIKEYLINNPIEVKNYSDFKCNLVNKGVLDRKEYKKLKSEYVTDLIKRAKNNIN
jgi:GrpB-like predicted nucleotidyltransferase (UPF0157 family)